MNGISEVNVKFNFNNYTTKTITLPNNGNFTLINADGEKKLELLPQRGIFYDFALHLLDGEEALVDAAQTFELTRACLVARDTADAYGDIEG